MGVQGAGRVRVRESGRHRRFRATPAHPHGRREVGADRFELKPTVHNRQRNIPRLPGMSQVHPLTESTAFSGSAARTPRRRPHGREVYCACSASRAPAGSHSLDREEDLGQGQENPGQLRASRRVR